MADKEKNMPMQEPENQETEQMEKSVEAEEAAIEETVDSEPEATVEEPLNTEPEESETQVEPEAEEPVAETEEAEAEAAEAQEELSEETTEEVGETESEETEEVLEQTDEEVAYEVAEETVEETAEEAAEETAEAPAEETAEEIAEETADESEESDEATEPESDSEGEEAEEEEVFEDDPVVIDPEDLVIHDEVVSAIKAEGEKLTNSEDSLKTYAKHSKEAIKNLEGALKTGQKALEANRDEKETPVILAGIIKICGKLLEVRCNNLENYVRVKAYTYYKEARKALHCEIDRYNDYVISYSSITGEQLTRLSVFLPENIASGKSLGVIPELSFDESYVQVFPDEELTAEEEATTTVITPVIGADDLLLNIKPPRSKAGCASYSRKIRRATKKVQREATRIDKQIAETQLLAKRYQSELDALEMRTPINERATDEYKNRVFKINIKYGKRLAGISTAKAASAFERTAIRLEVARFALEREKLVLAYEYLRNVYRKGRYSQKKVAEKFFANAVTEYNNAAKRCSVTVGIDLDLLPAGIIEQACRSSEIVFPAVAYKRELIETVGQSSKVISMAVCSDIDPDLEAYAETSAKILEKSNKLKSTTSLSPESAMVDRASAVAAVMLESLRDSADLVLTADEFDQFEVKCEKAIKFFKRALRRTERAISKAFDEHGVVTALVENLRVISNLIEVRRICISVAKRLNRQDLARSNARALYKNIDLYNGRAIDYMSIVGEQFSRIPLATSKELINSAEQLRIPVITYKDNYIEVFPKDPLKDSTYEKPRLWRSGIYTPLLMQHYRLTENRSVETTVINSPFVFDVMTDEMPATNWWHPIGLGQHLMVWAQPIVAWWHRVCTNIEIWFVDESLLFSKSGLQGRQNRNDRKNARFELKLKRLNDEHTAKILALETVVHESDRHGKDYQKKLYKINAKYSRKVYRLKVRYMRDCTERNAARLLLERLVLERERLSGINKVLIKYRNYGRITFTRNVLIRYKKKFVDAITAHNNTARKLSDMIGVKFAEVSTTVADEIIRYGHLIKFPEIVCCREVIETINGRERTVGDRWHGYGLYTGTTGSKAGDGNAPVMSVGAMGYATDMGVPFLKADFDGMTILGMTPGGVPLIGFNASGETSIPFTGTPMMLTGTDGAIVLDSGRYDQDSLILGAANTTDPFSGIQKRGVDARYTDEAEEDAKDLHSGIEVETPLDLETKMIEERFARALRARSMTSIDNVANWWKLVGSEINVRIMRRLLLRSQGFLRALLPPTDEFVEVVNRRVKHSDKELLRIIAKLGGIIDIECKRYYSAVKTGVRRSQRLWSAWLHDDIQRYNDFVRQYNKGKARYEHLELLSLNIPDTIKYRKTDRPPVPPVLSLRNRVKIDDNKAPIYTDEIYHKIVEYALESADRIKEYDVEKDINDSLFGMILSLPGKLFKFLRNLRVSAWVRRLRKIYYNDNKRAKAKIAALREKGKHKAADRRQDRLELNKQERIHALVVKILNKRIVRTAMRRQENENRHYRIRYEKARSMRRYNKNTLRAVGVASDPIKYQARVHKVLRQYLARNFRIDYNMRIRQLIYRGLRVDHTIYWIVTLAFALIIAIAGIFLGVNSALQAIAAIGIIWAALPIIFVAIRFVYDIVMFLASVVLLLTRNIWLIRYGARDIERHRYGAILDCFVNEQHKLLLACENVRVKPRSNRAKKILIATVNDYNKRIEVYSEVLRVPIKSIEITALLDKLTSGQRHELSELQNFVYVREIVERVDKHERCKTLNDRELGNMVEEINQVINGINIDGTDNQVAVDLIQIAMKKLIHFVQTEIRPTQNERYELKRDLIEGINRFDISNEKKEIFARNVIKVVDQLGGRDSRRIIGVLAADDMIFSGGRAYSLAQYGDLVDQTVKAINAIDLSAEANRAASEALHAPMQTLIAYARKSDKPGEGERLELKREFALACAGFEIPKSEVNELSKNLGEIVDQLGGKYGRKLIDVLIENGVKVS